MLSAFKTTLSSYIPRRCHLFGLGLVLVGSIISIWLNTQIDILSQGRVVGLSALTLAIIIGMVLGNTIYPRFAPKLVGGVSFAKGQLLRLAIMLYGFKLTLTQVASVGMPAIMIDAAVLSSTFILTYWLGTRWLKVDRQTTLLIGSGASICGAAAVIAAEPVIKAEAHKVTIAVATVVVFGTLAMLLYPVFYHLGWLQPWLSAQQYGIYTGSSVHEVAQVVVAGNAINTEVGNTAVVTKMIRVMMLAPFLLILSFLLTTKPSPRSNTTNMTNNSVPVSGKSALMRRLTEVKVPWFAFIFILIVVLHTVLDMSEPFIRTMVKADDMLLTMAMFALGLTTHLSAVKQAGIKPLLLGAIMFVWLIIGGGLINVFINQFI
ncbi:YeiH family protein [Psychrobacter pygoscelis]|uniref:YeiH family protein n=1 Tax=Psychrobacter pygoscelis TaxID=2488563 RepID=UPI00103949A7|nr:YeiH family protein [Psychrobacter pygoscelis]